jgi:hypothetical protein
MNASISFERAQMAWARKEFPETRPTEQFATKWQCTIQTFRFIDEHNSQGMKNNPAPISETSYGHSTSNLMRMLKKCEESEGEQSRKSWTRITIIVKT